ncbi:MAG: TIR domain-containing protein, partial [Chitinophagaceae bacterium]|nr:TIR domain-containing protein [Chitinophagaceae bacterium]
MVKSNKKALKVFISYSSKDIEYLNELLPYLIAFESAGSIELYYDGRISPGEPWSEVLSKFIREADVILFLLSADALVSDYITKEIEIALSQQKNGSSKIFPLLIKECNWQSSPISKFLLIPKSAKPIESFEEKERIKIYYELNEQLSKIIEDVVKDWELIIDKEFKDQTGILNLSNYSLNTIPQRLVEMTWLHSLILTNNQIEDISSLESLANLESIYLSSNRITNVDVLGKLTKLNFIDLNNNTVSDMIPICNLNPTYLYLQRNTINSIPSLSSLTKLTELDLSANNIAKIEGLNNLNQLCILNLAGNQINKIEGLTNLSSLQDLRLGNNKIEKIEGLEMLVNLNWLDLYRNNISAIEGLEKNIQLKMLGLSSNKISELANIDHLDNLETLYISHNNIEDITELQNFKKLRRAVLTNNKITDLFSLKPFIEKDIPIKAEFSFNPAEEGFFVKDNPVQYPPLEVVQQGKNAILRNFMQQRKALDEELEAYQSNEIKLILIGNANVGKTHIAHYIRTNRKTLPANNASTHGMTNGFVLYKSKAIPKPVKMRILDFGGQEYYHDTHHLFFTNDTIYLLLWEKNSNRFGLKTEKRFCQKSGSLEDETNAVFPVAYWMDAINYFINRKENEVKISSAKIVTDTNMPKAENPVDPVVVIVETKRDKKGGWLLDTSSILSFKKLIHSQSAISLYRDDSTGTIINTGTGSLFDCLDNLIGTMNEKRWSGYYKLVVDFFENINTVDNKKILADLQANGLVIKLNDCVKLFNKIIRNARYKYKFDNANAEDLCRFLANRGYIIYYDNERICLYPEKLTKEIYAVLKIEYKRSGMINRQEADTQNPDVLGIMEKFKLLVPHPAGDGFIAPQLLPESANNDLNLFLEVFKPPVIRFSFTGYIHKNIVQELFYSFKKELIQDSTQNYIWKNGFVIKIENELYKINISSNENSRLIDVQYLNTINMRVLNDISNTITSAMEGRSFCKEVSIDGKLFIPIIEIEQHAPLAQFVFDKKIIRVADYKNFLSGDNRKAAMKKLFISYSSKNTEFMKRFVTHLEPLRRIGDIDYWHDRKIEPGTRWDDSIKKELELSDIVIFLISPDFIATDYIFDVEIPQALQQFTTQTSKLFFIELQRCSWDKTILAQYQQTTDSNGSNKELITIT